MNRKFIPYNKAYIAGRELYYIAQAVFNGDLKGDGPFGKMCERWFEDRLSVSACLLTPSCTAALEMCPILLDIESGDEVILPSFTFTSTANAFLLRGATLKFVDIRPDTLNIDESLIEQAVTSRTRAICVVHYAGVGCAMDEILQIAKKYNLAVIEDAAHAVLAKYKGRHLGGIGDLGTFSFHETKNYSCGEGGALLIREPSLCNKAEIVREKGTNRSQFFRGEIDKYSWVSVGSSYLPSEIVAAFLYGQLEHAEAMNQERLAIWNKYYSRLKALESKGLIRLPTVPLECEHNAHLFYILFPDPESCERLRVHLNHQGIGAVFHYQPLHSSPVGIKIGTSKLDLPVTNRIARVLLRLPLFCGLSLEDQDYICDIIEEYYASKHHKIAI